MFTARGNSARCRRFIEQFPRPRRGRSWRISSPAGDPGEHGAGAKLTDPPFIGLWVSSSGIPRGHCRLEPAPTRRTIWSFGRNTTATAHRSSAGHEWIRSWPGTCRPHSRDRAGYPARTYSGAERRRVAFAIRCESACDSRWHRGGQSVLPRRVSSSTTVLLHERDGFSTLLAPRRPEQSR